MVLIGTIHPVSWLSARKYYLANIPADATIEALAATIKADWVCEQAHQQLKEELVPVLGGT
jgi:SRSO17 transposase